MREDSTEQSWDENHLLSSRKDDEVRGFLSGIWYSGIVTAKIGVVYILANSNRTVLYVGVTSDLQKRIWEHKHKLVQGFTSKYRLDRLVYYEEVGDMEKAIKREKQLKRWRRRWKEELITNFNPEWKDLYWGVCL